MLIHALLALTGLSLLVASQNGPAWNIELARKTTARTTLRVINRCRLSHTFEVTASSGMDWFNLVSGTRLQVAPQQTGTLEVAIDSNGLELGVYKGEIVVKRLTHHNEPDCEQSREVLTARLKVIWSPEELEAHEATEYLPGQIMVVLDTRSTSSIDKVVAELEAQYGLLMIHTYSLRSLSKTVALYAIPSTGETIPSVVRTLQANSKVWLAQPNFVYSTLSVAAGSQEVTVYDDQYADLQYGPVSIRAPAAHKNATGKGVKVAVIDTGMDFEHVDLKGNVSEKTSFMEDDTEFKTDIHGTLVAGVIAAVANNRMGIFGVAPDCKLLAIKACRPKSRTSIDADCSSRTLAQGLDFAILKRAQVINLSLGGPRDPLVARLINKAAARGSIIVAAAGNGGATAKPCYPAALENVIAVSAVDAADRLYESANRGDYIDLVAPGVEILSTVPGNRFNVFTGTSMAAPHVAGTLALLLEKAGRRGIHSARKTLEDTARDLGPAGPDARYGQGCVDADRAVKRIMGPISFP